MFKEFGDDAGAADAVADVTLFTPVRPDDYGIWCCWVIGVLAN